MRSRKLLKRLTILGLFCVLSLPVQVFGVPGKLSHQGRIIDSNNDPVSGVANVTFQLFRAPSGGSAVWEQTIDVTFDAGYYSVELGPGSPELSPEFFDGSDFYLGITLEDQDEFNPRQRLLSTAYAMRAGAADLVTGEVNAIGGLRVDGNELVDSDGNLNIPGTLHVGESFEAEGPLKVSQINFDDLPDASEENTGQLYYVTDMGTFYYSNGSQWLNLSTGGGGIQPPVIASISPALINPSTDVSITITGEEFEDGCIVEFGDTPSESVEFQSPNQVTADSGALESGVYTITLINPVGLRAILADGLTVNTAPEWVTAGGDLGFVADAATGDHFTLEAIDAEGETLTYTVVANILPPGLLLDSETGVISGDPDDVEDTTNYEFTVSVADTALNEVERVFSIQITDMIGQVAEAPGDSCKHILDTGSSVGNGTYWIGGENAYEVYCDMETADGGWTLLGTSANRDGYNWLTDELWLSRDSYGNYSILDSSDAKSPAYGVLNINEVMLMISNKSNDPTTPDWYTYTTDNCVDGVDFASFMDGLINDFQGGSGSGVPGSPNCSKSCSTTFAGDWPNPLNSGESNVLTFIKHDGLNSDTHGYISTFACTYSESDSGMGSNEEPGYSTTNYCDVGNGYGCPGTSTSYDCNDSGSQYNPYGGPGCDMGEVHLMGREN